MIYRNHKNVNVLSWLSANEFVGTVERVPMGREDLARTRACYGWSKGAGFFVYTIEEGHIEKIGSLTRSDLTPLD